MGRHRGLRRAGGHARTPRLRRRADWQRLLVRRRQRHPRSGPAAHGATPAAPSDRRWLAERDSSVIVTTMRPLSSRQRALTASAEWSGEPHRGSARGLHRAIPLAGAVEAGGVTVEAGRRSTSDASRRPDLTDGHSESADYRPVTADEIRRRIAKVPRVPLALTPTPLQDAPRLAEELGIGRLLDQARRPDRAGVRRQQDPQPRVPDGRGRRAGHRGVHRRAGGAVELGAPDDRRRQHPRHADHPGAADRPRLGLAGQPADRPHPGRGRPLAGDRRPGRHGPDPARRRRGAAPAWASGRTS